MNPSEKLPDPSTQASTTQRPAFLRLLTHELRNFVAPVHNAVHLLRLKSRTDPGLTPIVDIIERQLAGMARALDAVSDADRLARGDLVLERAAVELQPVLERARQAARPLLESRRQQVDLDVPAAMPAIDADAGRLGRVFAALLDNAARYGSDGARIALAAREEADGIVVTIEDEGPGLSVDMQAHGLEFADGGEGDGHRQAQGLGLGLPLAAAIVRLHGGAMMLESPGRGLRVVVRLPKAGVAQSAADQGTSTSVPVLDPPASSAKLSRRVLIADDSAAVRASLADLLEELGHEVRAAADGLEAVEMARAWEPEFVLLDIHMPRLSGFDAARQIRALFPRPGMQLVMMSGDGLDAGMRRGAEQAGFDHCIDKALAIGELTGLLERDADSPPA
ncbi:MAG: hybrid sensor histidine kinase/response regulator [Casimicrobiaceae bacterium]